MTVIKGKSLMEQFNSRMKELMTRDVLVGIPGELKPRKPVKNKPPEKKSGVRWARKKGSLGGASASSNSVKITNAEIGFINEFGSPARRIPPRPFLIPGVKEAKKDIVKILKGSVADISKEDAVTVALNKVGTKARDSVKGRIRKSVGMKGLSKRTQEIRRKRLRRPRDGLMRPLIDSGQLINSITYIVDD